MGKVCSTCGKCGSGKPKVKTNDPVQKALCGILCEVRKEVCEGKHKGKKPSSVAEGRAKNSASLKRAVNRKYGAGSKTIVNRSRLVPYKNAPKSWGRKPLSPSAVKRHLKPLRDKLIRQAQNTLKRKAVQKAATAWTKFVPVLNVLSTAYDIYDIATTGYDLYKTIDKALDTYRGDVFRVRPDVAIEGANGKLDIYDFKFDGDRWQKGQKQLYDKAIRDTNGKGKAKEVSDDTCKCDGPMKPTTGSAGV